MLISLTLWRWETSDFPDESTKKWNIRLASFLWTSILAHVYKQVIFAIIESFVKLESLPFLLDRCSLKFSIKYVPSTRKRTSISLYYISHLIQFTRFQIALPLWQILKFVF